MFDQADREFGLVEFTDHGLASYTLLSVTIFNNVEDLLTITKLLIFALDLCRICRESVFVNINFEMTWLRREISFNKFEDEQTGFY
jgi:hypothetical protein